MRDLGLVFQQAGGIVVGLAFVALGGYFLWFILKENVKNPGWRRFLWTIGEILLIIIVLRFVVPRQATALYQEGRDWWINVPSRDIGILFNNLGTAINPGSDSSSDYRPLESLPQSAPAPSGATQQDSYAPLEKLENPPAASSGSLMPQTGRSAGEMMGGAVLATCSDNDCPNGQCPEGCRASYTWIHGSGRYGRICNASEPNQPFAWVRVNVLDAAWANAFVCPSIR